MTLNIVIHHRTVDIAEAVEYSNTPHYVDGQLEAMRARADLQDKMMARIMAVIVGEYEDHFSQTQFQPKTMAEKLSFMLGEDVMVTE